MANSIIIAGPTASGKSQLAVNIALQLEGEIINADSVAFYRYFDIGTAKPSAADLQKVPHHLFDILDPTENLDAARYGELSGQIIKEINQRGKIAIIVGGSGLYLRSLMGNDFHDLPHDENLRKRISGLSSAELREKLLQVDPERASEIHPNDHFRLARALEIFTLTQKTMAQLKVTAAQKPKLKSTVVILDPDRGILHERIAKRTSAMLQMGLVDEVRKILELGFPKTCKPFTSIGYKEVVAYIDGKIDLAQLEEKILFATRQYAKSQCTWFKKTEANIRLKSNEITSSEMDVLKKIFTL